MTKRKLLLVHPDYKLSAIYSNHLSSHFRVDSAYDGLTALRKFRTDPPTVIVSEYLLPLLSGVSLLKFVRQQPKFQALPFIFLSTHEDNAEALNYGANDWIDTRISSPDLLLERIHRIHKIYAI